MTFFELNEIVIEIEKVEEIIYVSFIRQNSYQLVNLKHFFYSLARIMLYIFCIPIYFPISNEFMMKPLTVDGTFCGHRYLQVMNFLSVRPSALLAVFSMWLMTSQMLVMSFDWERGHLRMKFH